MTALLTDNLPLLAGAPNGIQKLRELILELAVRGKLVPQDPSDEPASELLKRIAEEKARLVAEGKIRKQKPLAEIGEEERPFELPEGWEWIRLSDLLPEFQNGASSRGDSDGLPVTVLRLADIRAGEISLDDTRTLMLSAGTISKYTLEDGDILLIRVNGSADLVGRFVVCRAALQAIPCDHFIRMRFPRGVIDSAYLKLVGDSEIARSAIAGLFVSTAGQKTVNQGHVGSLSVPLPPLPEQHRIVAKVDELMALCDRLEARQADAASAHARLVQALLDSLTQASDAEDFAASWQRLAEHFHSLFSSESSIDALKQILLQLAVMGKLVPQDLMEETGEKLLRRIQCSREDKRKIVAISDDVQASVNGLLPENWVWGSVDQISADDSRAITDGPFGANLKTEHYISDPGFRVVRLQNIGSGWFRDEHRAYVDQGRFEKIIKHQVLPGDLIVAGLIDSSIRCCSVPEDIGPAVVKADCYRFCVHPLVSSKYVLYYLNSKMAHEFAAIHHHGLTLTRIGLGNFRSIPVPLPPAAEQHRIVAKLDQLMSFCDQLKARLTAARQLHERLAGALVEQAVA